MEKKKFLEFRRRIEEINLTTHELVGKAPEYLHDALRGAAAEAQANLVREYRPVELLRRLEDERAELKTVIRAVEVDVRKFNEKIESIDATSPDTNDARAVLESMREMGADSALVQSFEKKLGKLQKAHQNLVREREKQTEERNRKVKELAELRNELARLTMPSLDFLGDEELKLACGTANDAQDFTEQDKRSVTAPQRRAAVTSKVDTPHTHNASERILDVLISHAKDHYLSGMSQDEINARAYSEPPLKQPDTRARALLYHMLNGANKKTVDYLAAYAPGMVLQTGKRKSRKDPNMKEAVYRVVNRLDVDKNPPNTEYGSFADVAPASDAPVVEEVAAEPTIGGLVLLDKRRPDERSAEPFAFLKGIVQLKKLDYMGHEVTLKCRLRIENDARVVVSALLSMGLDFAEKQWSVWDVVQASNSYVEAVRKLLVCALDHHLLENASVRTMAANQLAKCCYGINQWVRILLSQRYSVYNRESWQAVGKTVGIVVREVANNLTDNQKVTS